MFNNRIFLSLECHNNDRYVSRSWEVKNGAVGIGYIQEGIPLNKELHLKQKLSMFSVLPQNCKHFFFKFINPDYKHPDANNCLRN